MNAGSPKLEAFDLTVQFAGVRALDGVSIDVAPGEVVAIIGPNGAGKTTLFNVLTGFVSPTAGRVQLGDEDITTLSPAARTRRGLSRTFQQGGLWLSETAVGNLLIASYLTVDTDSPVGLLGLGRRERQRELDRLAMADDVLAILGLTGYRDVSAADMPYGSRKLLELGCALLTRPAVLLLDEPAAGASREEIPRLSGVIRDIRARLGVTVVVIEHHVPLVREVADRIYVLNFGQVIAAGTPDEVTEDPTVIEAYLGSGSRAPRRSSGGGRRRTHPLTATPEVARAG
jgi:branched-chain amino acid transport system ATP-binding protein